MNTQKNIDYKYECENFQSFYSQFKELGKGFFLAMHRGSFEYAPENSLSAIQKSMELGLFIIEIDVQMTKDGVIILMHDDSIDRMTNGSGEISELTYEQIKSFYLKDNNGGTDAPITKEKVPTLVEVMNLVKGRAIVNIDKCWGIRNKVCEVLRETGTFDYGLLKSDAGIDEVKEFLNSNGDNLLYMHKINEESMYQLELIIEEIAPIAFEVAFINDRSPIIADDMISKMKKHANVWVNSLDVSTNGGHTDTLSLKNPDEGWGWLINKGVNIIQTDYPLLLQSYMKGKRLKQKL